jgi:hypothetical protein
LPFNDVWKISKQVGCFGSIGLHDPESDLYGQLDKYGEPGLYFPDVLDQQWTAIVHSTPHQTGAKWFMITAAVPILREKLAKVIPNSQKSRLVRDQSTGMGSCTQA